jgi:FdhE protein
MTSYRDKISFLEKSAESSPEYAEIVPFFQELFRFLEKHGGESGISFLIPEDGAAVRVANGFPLISSDSVRVDSRVCHEFMHGVIGLLKRIGRDGSDKLERIEIAMERGALDPGQIFRGILERNRAIIDESAASINVPPPLLEYVFEIPLKTALELHAAGVGVDAFPAWHESYCPVCGSRAGMAELAGEEGKRFLSCSACNFRWPFKRLQCPFCGNEEAEKLSYFLVDDGTTRVDTCKACSRYIKTRDSRKGDAGLPLDLVDMLTIHLDLVAVREGFERGK